jgi:hypothetical protein
VAFHISNRYLSLSESLAAAGNAAGLVSMVQFDVTAEDEAAEGKEKSQWMVLARSKEDFGPLLKDPGWDAMPPNPSIRPWRDDFSNLLEAFLRKRREEE